MAEIARELGALAELVELPAERDVWPAVEPRLAPGPPRDRLRAAAVVFAAAAVAIGIAFAVPPARSAILRFLGLEGLSIVRVEKLPPVKANPAVVGTRTTLAAAAAALHFEPRLPAVGTPEGVYLDPSRVAVLVVYGRPVRLRLEETRLGIFRKVVSFNQQVDRVAVNGDVGVWLTGDHVFDDVFSQPRLAANALIWQHAGVTYRLEGRFTETQALGVARSFGTR